MYALIETGGKQYKAVEGAALYIETLPVSAGDKVEFDGICFDEKGMKQAKIIGTATNFARGPKIIVFKKNRRHNYRRKNGHRQDLLRVVIEKITAA